MKTSIRACALCLVLLGVSACGFFTEGREFATVKGAEFYDESLITAELVMCRAASVGSIMRRYGRSSDTAEAWATLCQAPAPAAETVIRAPLDLTSAPVQ